MINKLKNKITKLVNWAVGKAVRFFTRRTKSTEAPAEQSTEDVSPERQEELKQAARDAVASMPLFAGLNLGSILPEEFG